MIFFENTSTWDASTEIAAQHAAKQAHETFEIFEKIEKPYWD